MAGWQLGIDTHAAALDALANLLEARGAKTATAKGGDGPALVASFTGAVDLSLMDAVGAWLSNLDARDARLCTRGDPKGVWSDGWRGVYGPIAVSERVGVYPIWAPRPGDHRPAWVSVDPTPAFGSGAHPTTRVALGLLDACLAAHPGAAVLDVGAGSGILAIAAALLGSEAVGVEIDPVAVRAAQANALRNGVSNRTRFMAGSVDKATGTYPVVVANILADVVCPMAADIAERATGELIVTAMPGAEADRVLAAFADFEQVAAVDEGQWRLLHLRRRAGAAKVAAGPAAPGKAKVAEAPAKAAEAPKAEAPKAVEAPKAAEAPEAAEAPKAAPAGKGKSASGKASPKSSAKKPAKKA